MRTELKNVSKKEFMFKAIEEYKSSRNKCRNTIESLDEEEANFMRRLKRGLGKYK